MFKQGAQHDAQRGRHRPPPPADGLADLKALNRVPLWPSLRAVLPPTKPRPDTRAAHGPCPTLKPLRLKAGELTPIEKAERRVRVLANPGHGLEKKLASAAIDLGRQLLLPGEWAPSHRHTPNAVRWVVDGEGGWTPVDGGNCPMGRGDLIDTPGGLWHEPGHDGDRPVVWLDQRGLPLVHDMEASDHVDGARPAPRRGRGDRTCLGGGLVSTPVPTPVFGRSGKAYPMRCYPGAPARAALEALAADRPEAGWCHAARSAVSMIDALDIAQVWVAAVWRRLRLVGRRVQAAGRRSVALNPSVGEST